MSDPTSPNPETPLSDAAIGAVVALVRVCELYDRTVAHRAALRATVASLVTGASNDLAGVERSVAIAAAALADIELVIARPLDPEADAPDRSSTLGATLVSAVPGLRAVATALESRASLPDELDAEQVRPAIHVVAAADALVGNPADGYLPTWDHALRRCERLSAADLHPDMLELLREIDLDSIEVPVSPSDRVHRLLVEATEPGDRTKPRATPATTTLPDPLPRPEESTTATTIKTAVAAAGHTHRLLALFAETAQRMVSAADVVVLEVTATELSDEPVARAIDSRSPVLPLARLDDLREFSTQAEIRAGTTLERPSSDDARELVVPLLVGGETWGVMVVTRRREQPAFDAHDSSVLRHIASEAADAVASTTHWARMERMALRDQLTGLANRHELYRVLDEIFERPPLERVDCALIMCDVDGLKVVNDTLGHQAGDRLLIDAAAALRGAVRDPERTTICRIGGDEFCLVIDGGALLTAHDVSDTIERLFARSAGSGAPRSISCGIAFATEEIESRSALLRSADENQYQTKRARKAAREAMAQEIGATATTPVVDRRAIRD